MWDVHCHIFPRRYIKELSSLHEIGISPPDSLGRNILYDKETKQTLTYFIEGTPHVDVNKHLEDMREFGIEKQFLSVSPPHLDKIKEPRRALQLSQAINDGLSEIVDVDREHLSALATLPTTDLSLAMDELRRIIKLGLPGVALPSNTAKRFYDEGYDDLFKEISSKGLLLFIHPTEPVVWDRLGEDYNLALLYGWPFDTTLSVARLVFSGTIARYPGLKVVVSHGGG
ncbi:hypothetical protein HS1genome_0550 [Sulfodiicoccus acidiphilus]|nr:amidohydrolase family protein [Sulfodiicoccus acidiphilus]BBD72161.1 hypothetical protein HS1genome_0550 [Sulfodiicoccus acidiphilus]